MNWSASYRADAAFVVGEVDKSVAEIVVCTVAVVAAFVVRLSLNPFLPPLLLLFS